MLILTFYPCLQNYVTDQASGEHGNIFPDGRNHFVFGEAWKYQPEVLGTSMVWDSW